MDIYRRYFRVTKGKLITAYNDAQKINKAAYKAYQEILSDIGAKPEYYQYEKKMVCFVFENQPDTKIYKRRDQGWYPKRNNKIGKELAIRIEAVVTKNVQSTLEVVGLTHLPTITGNGKCYWPSLTVVPESKPVLYVSIPWYDVDPEKMEQYKIDHDGDQDLESLQWKPTEDMEEVKGWEVDKHIYEWNTSVKNK